jgi:tetratricopeptide (TPR) repeat protein
MRLLEEAIRENPKDARAPYYLGNLLYDRKRYNDAIAQWERAAELDPEFPTSWRNLGFAYFNVLHDPARSLHAFAQARALAPRDARILYEQDQLLKRVGRSPDQRLATLESNATLVETRDDLSLQLATLYNNRGQPERALEILRSRRFQPWEGGEGLVLSQYVRANLLLGQRALDARNNPKALRFFRDAWNPPRSLNEAKHLLMNLSMVDYWLGVAYAENGEQQRACQHWEHAARDQGDFQQMQVQSVSDMTYWSAMALRRLSREQEALDIFRTIYDYSLALEQQTPKIDYFATSLPAMLLFEEDLRARQSITARFLRSQAWLGFGEQQKALDLLHEVQGLDRSHTGAIDLLRELEG